MDHRALHIPVHGIHAYMQLHCSADCKAIQPHNENNLDIS